MKTVFYSLAEFAYVRVESHGVVWLNARDDRYIGQRRSEVRGLSNLVKGWRHDPDDDTTTAETATANAERLITQGLIVRGDCGRSAEPPALPVPSASLRFEECRYIPPRHVLRFRAACRTVQKARGRSFEYALKLTREHKAGHVRREPDLELMQKVVSVFHRLRAFWYGSHNECLNDSLILMEFLAAFELHPTLVIGATLRPFAAHCWVQAGEYVLNDHPNNVQRYLPILTI